MPYRAKTKGSTCGQAAKCPAVAKMANATIIGGAYGMPTELSIMQEILRNGPVATDFNVPGRSWGFYHGGILKED